MNIQGTGTVQKTKSPNTLIEGALARIEVRKGAKDDFAGLLL
jgi:hypothetical protein